MKDSFAVHLGGGAYLDASGSIVFGLSDHPPEPRSTSNTKEISPSFPPNSPPSRTRTFRTKIRVTHSSPGPSVLRLFSVHSHVRR
jgi:hypothetical protein